MAPEQVRGGPVDARCDIFAFGVILYEMLTGRRAFERDTPAETMSAILNEDPPPVSQTAEIFPASMQKIVSRCLEKKPEKRFNMRRTWGSRWKLSLIRAARRSLRLANRSRVRDGYGSPRPWLL